MSIISLSQADPFQVAFDQHPEATLLMDMNSSLITSANTKATALLKRSKSEMEGLPFATLLPADHKANTSEFSNTLLQQGRAEDSWELQVGEEQTARFHVTATRVEQGGQNWVLLTLREQKQSTNSTHAQNNIQQQVDLLTQQYAQLNDPLQEMVSWIELKGDPRLKRPAEKLTKMLHSLRCATVPQDLTPSSELDTICHPPARRIPCTENTVLIVDDETNIRNLFNNMIRLGIPDVALDMAAGGQEALKIFEEKHHSLILLDLKMPAMNGEEVLQSIHQVCRLKSWVPPAVILCSGYNGQSVANKMIDKQIPCTFLQKPVSRAKLVEVVHRQCLSTTI